MSSENDHARSTENAVHNAEAEVTLAPPSPLNGVRLRTGKGIGGKRGRSGRKPLDIGQEAERLLRKPKARQALLAVITDDRHPHFAAMWRALADRAWGKPAASLIVGNAPNAIEAFLQHRAQQRQLNQLAAQDEQEQRPRHIFRVVEDISKGRLTSQERRVYLCRELAEFARDAAVRDPAWLEFAKLLDKLGKVSEPHPIDGPEPFTFNIDKANGDEPVRPVTTITIKREPRGLDGRPVDGTSEPNESVAPLVEQPDTLREVSPAPAPEAAAVGRTWTDPHRRRPASRALT